MTVVLSIKNINLSVFTLSKFILLHLQGKLSIFLCYISLTADLIFGYFFPPYLFLCLSGWIISLTALKYNSGVGAIMMINAILFTAESALGVILLKKVRTE